MLKRWIALLMLCALALSAGCAGESPSGSASFPPAPTRKISAAVTATPKPTATPVPLPDVGTLIAQYDASKGMVITWAPFVTNFTCTLERKDGAGASFETVSTVPGETGTYTDAAPGAGGAQPVYRLCVSDGSRKAYSTEAQGEVTFEVGNTGGNLQSGGLACVSGGMLYRMGIQDGVIGVYAIDDTGAAKLMVSGISSQLNAADGFLYYVSQATGGLYRVALTGGDPQLVCSDKLLFVLAVDDRVYATLADGGALIAMDGDGGNRETLVARGCYDIGVSGQTLYYTNTVTSEFCMRHLITGATKGVPVTGRCFAQLLDGRIYYRDEQDGGKLASCAADGTDVQTLSDAAASGINVTARGAYFINQDDGDTPCRVALDGTGMRQLASVSGDYICTMGDDLLLIDAEGKFYQIRDDGTVIRLYG